MRIENISIKFLRPDKHTYSQHLLSGRDLFLCQPRTTTTEWTPLVKMLHICLMVRRRTSETETTRRRRLRRWYCTGRPNECKWPSNRPVPITGRLLTTGQTWVIVPILIWLSRSGKPDQMTTILVGFSYSGNQNAWLEDYYILPDG